MSSHMTNLPVFDSALKALDKVQQNNLQCPYRCQVKNKQGLVFEAEITLSTQGYCLSAVEPEKLRRDIKWLEYLEQNKGDRS